MRNLGPGLRVFTFASICLLQSLDLAFAADSQSEANAPLKTAIFVRNSGGAGMIPLTDVFSDQLSAKLTEKGFAVMDWKDVVKKFSESNEPDASIYANVKTLMAVGTETPSTQSGTVLAESAAGSPADLAYQGASGGMAKASALRIAQMLDADYIIIASFAKVGHEKRNFKGEGTIYKTDNVADIYSLPMTVKVLDGDSGQSVYGDAVTASDRILQNASISVSVDNMPERLIEIGTTKIADNVTDKVRRIRETAVKAVTTVPFMIECNVEGATVELDGAAIGSPPSSFNASPGVHQLTVTREYFQPWERTVNIFPNQKISVSLELSTEGLAKYKDITAFRQDLALQKLEREATVDIAKEQSKADADAKEKISSGIETALKNSYIRSEHFQEGLTTLVRTGNDPILPVVPVPPSPVR